MQIIVSGLIFGCIYGLAALGLVLIHRTTGVVNFAHGEMAMVTTFFAFTLLSGYHLPYFAAFVLALAFAAVFGMLVYLVLMRPIRQAPHLNQLVLTLGLFLAFHGMAGLIWGHKPHSFPEAVSGGSFGVAGVFVTPDKLFIVAVTLLLTGALFLLFRFTRLGLAMRASSQDLMAARLMGINVDLVFLVTWGAGILLGGVAGLLTAPVTYLSVTMMFNVLILAFAAAVLGGFVSMPGALIGGLMIGVFNNLISFYWAPQMATVFTFVLIIGVLYVRPQGLFGGGRRIKKV